MRDETDEPDLARGMIAGLVGGLVASFAMEQFQALWAATSRKWQDPKPGRKAKPTTVKAADAIAERVVGHKVRKKHQKLAGEAVHYAMGGSSAAIYGMLAEVAPIVTAGEGAAFGAAVWLAADEATLAGVGPNERSEKDSRIHACLRAGVAPGLRAGRGSRSARDAKSALASLAVLGG